MRFRGLERGFVRYLKREMLDRGRCVLVPANGRPVRQFDEREDVAASRIDEDVHLGHMMLREDGRISHAEQPVRTTRPFLPRRGSSDVMITRELERRAH
jgi:hypothetical protein